MLHFSIHPCATQLLLWVVYSDRQAHCLVGKSQCMFGPEGVCTILVWCGYGHRADTPTSNSLVACLSDISGEDFIASSSTAALPEASPAQAPSTFSDAAMLMVDRLCCWALPSGRVASLSHIFRGRPFSRAAAGARPCQSGCNWWPHNPGW